MLRRIQVFVEPVRVVDERVTGRIDRPEVQRIVALEGVRYWIEVQLESPAETCVLHYVRSVRNAELQELLHVK